MVFPVIYDRILLTQEFNGMLENVCVLARRFEYRPMKISKQSIIMVVFFQMRTENKEELCARAHLVQGI